jgi:1,3,6,8-tetrahydroxynaphthalene synthase
MPVLCHPAVDVPEHIITAEETLALAERQHAAHPQLPLALIRNTGVRKRHIIQPIEQTLRHPGFEERNSPPTWTSARCCPTACSVTRSPRRSYAAGAAEGWAWNATRPT